MDSRPVKNAQVFRYYAGLTTDVSPVVTGNRSFSFDQRMSDQFLHLHLEGFDGFSDMQVGATYGWTGRLPDGSPTVSHWMF